MPKHANHPVLIPDSIYAPLASGFLILVAGLFGLTFHRPWLFASLAPTAFQLAEYPELRSSRLYNVLAGHYIGLAMGFAALALFDSWGAPKVLATHDLTAIRVWTSVVAMVFTSAGILVFRASHPPAGSTTLLVSLGSFQTWRGVIIIVVGVAIVGLLGEVLRIIRLAESNPKGATFFETVKQLLLKISQHS
jgi:CBS domain-containing membrane protein